MSAVMACFDPLVIPVGVAIFFAIVFTTKYVSLGSLAIAILFPLWVTLRCRILDENPYFVHMLIVTLCYTLTVFYMHRANIGRLLNGTENKIGQKKGEEK